MTLGSSNLSKGSNFVSAVRQNCGHPHLPQQLRQMVEQLLVFTPILNHNPECGTVSLLNWFFVGQLLPSCPRRGVRIHN